MAKRNPWLLTGLGLAVALIVFYLNYAFFFNPLSFQKSTVTHLPWQWYRNPLQLEYAVLDDDGWKITTTCDRAEIDLVFRELQKGEDTETSTTQIGGQQIWFGVRRLSDGAILLSVNGYEQTGTCQLEAAKEIKLTERLRQLLKQRLQEARNTIAQKRHTVLSDT